MLSGGRVSLGVVRLAPLTLCCVLVAGSRLRAWQVSVRFKDLFLIATGANKLKRSEKCVLVNAGYPYEYKIKIYIREQKSV